MSTSIGSRRTRAAAGTSLTAWTPDETECGAAPAPREHRGPRRRDATRTRPRWALPGLAALLVAAAVTYLWDLTVSGYGNTFYAAAVRAGSRSWTALLFGSLDANNGITVDKPPAAYWIPGLLARLDLIQLMVLLTWIAEYPTRRFFFGIPAWVLGLVIVLVSVLGSLGRGDAFGVLTMLIGLPLCAGS